MTKYEFGYRSAAAFVGIVSGYLYGTWTPLIVILVVFIALDYLSGLIAAAYAGALSSRIGFKGIAKKVMVFVIIAASHLCDRVIGTKNMIMDATIYFYLANELLSIIENAGRTGLPVPEHIRKIIAVLKNQNKNM